MKYTVITLLVLILTTINSAFSQNKGTITFEWNNENDDRFYYDLYFNIKESSYYIANIPFKIDTSVKAVADHQYVQKILSPVDTTSLIVKTDLPHNVMYRLDEIYENSGKYTYYRDSIYNFKWQIMPDSTKVILGFTCSKAKAFFRGHNYEAWFTENIPLPFGPFYMHGAPGMLMEVAITGKDFKSTYTAVKVDFKTPIPDNKFDSHKYQSNKTPPMERKEFMQKRNAARKKTIAALSIPQKDEHGSSSTSVKYHDLELF